ncbi:uncharacterized protein LOC125889421 [Epinephelus fuscoguttatus]|uniref:uncharacterized protein LOC125889421 n=1 Tax=Epinephelus fuscoguttatus TaxID=293821 RepID=UPI0020D118FE|nr:uncharacterized protein LOC125889421 [Epinephelus fuscoguttatus]
MAEPMKPRVIVEEDDYRRLDLHSGKSKTLMDLHKTICDAFGIERDFRIQFMDPDFNNEFMNITSVQDIQDRGTIKLVYMQNCLDMNPISRPNSPSTAGSSASPSSIHTPQSVSSLSSSDSDTTIILSHSDSELRTCAWPRDFTIPHFPYDVEVQLQRENEIFRETGTSLKIPPGLKPDILDKLAEEIFQYTAYLQNHQIDVAGALTQKFPCLRDLSATGYYSWMISLKYKMANYRTKMRDIGCPEMTVNALKNKSRDECFHSAKNVKKAKKAEVNYCPSHPTGETDDSLENLRVELLTDVKGHQM